jgi:hypothetical protein
MEGCLSNCSPVLNIPAVLGEPIRVRFFRFSSLVLSKEVAAFKLKTEGIVA